MRNKEEIQGRFKELQDRFGRGECSVSELEELELLMEDERSADHIQQHMYAELEEAQYPTVHTFNKSKLFDKIKGEIVVDKKEGKLRSLYLKLVQAAAILIVFVLGAGSLFVYERVTAEKPQPTSYCEIYAPLGSKSKVVLPDNSIVWLNAGSRLKYSNLFNQVDRNLTLEGEGYFKVAKNKKIPFRVDADHFIVEAVGTEFNVRAYKEDEAIVTSLVEGKVKLEHASEKIADNIYLNPNHKATFYKNKSKGNNRPRLIIRPNVDLSPNIAWKNNQLILNKERLEDLSVDLERMYDCKIHFNSEEIKSYMFSGTITDMGLNEILDVIKLSTPVNYEVKGKDVYIGRDNKRIGKFKKY
ncbi:FecR family protein [Plebeiibacterium marinum]|uniref:FecR family protein n=1 Tax=Plebeiibacterium marinum TaxID=2992111 RepID=A0AAE3MAW7_9BACT|nr:FecR family protein [Plebeiobacterium marinum]MCW3804471.1 FecR family protein [Plebeiobacterium marinum]